MNKSTPKPNESLNLANITTYESGVAQASAFRVIKGHTAHLLKDYGLSSMQWFTIGIVLDAGKKGIRLSDLAKKLDTTLAYMTTTVNYLESRGILVKSLHEFDARTKLIMVKPSYVKTCKEIEEALREHLRKVLYKNISREELTIYVQVLYKLSQSK